MLFSGSVMLSGGEVASTGGIALPSTVNFAVTPEVCARAQAT
jgi:hypothetical protein